MGRALQFRSSIEFGFDLGFDSALEPRVLSGS